MRYRSSGLVRDEVFTEEKRRTRRFVAHFNAIHDFLKKQVPHSARKERADARELPSVFLWNLAIPSEAAG
jgi:hypothetical protein